MHPVHSFNPYFSFLLPTLTTITTFITAGESCMWGETVDPSDLHNTVWPRAAAVAEVLWTPYEVIYPTNTSTGKI